jgi:hypothetical protein
LVVERTTMLQPPDMTVFIAGGGVNPASPPPNAPVVPDRLVPAKGVWKFGGRVGDLAKDGARWMYFRPLGSVVIAVLIISVATIPLAHEYGLLANRKWLWLWLALFAVDYIIRAVAKGRARDRENAEVTRVHGSVAGSIDSLTQKMLASPDHRLSQEEGKNLAAGLLHRIKDYAECILPKLDKGDLRVTLAVPWNDGDKDCLRVWCYDQTYPDRRWTTLPLPDYADQALPGSPAAFVTRRMQIIEDVTKIEGPHGFRGQSFRSVLSMPIFAAGPDGTCLGVVNIDATKPRYFTRDLVERKVYPLVAPSLNLLGLVLLLKREGSDYAFGS